MSTAERARLDAAIAQSRKQLSKLRARLAVLPEDSQAEIAPLIDAYLQMIGPSRLVRGARRRIAEALVIGRDRGARRDRGDRRDASSATPGDDGDRAAAAAPRKCARSAAG